MPKLIDLVQVNRLLDQLAAVEEKLTPNERELFHKLKAKYREPGATSFDDKTCLEVMLRNVEIRRGYALDPKDTVERNVEIRRGYALDPKDTVGRIIDLPRTGDAEDA